MRTQYIEGLPGYDVQPVPEQEIKAPGANAKIDAAIRRGVMPNAQGGPTIDPRTGMARGVKVPVQTAQPSSLTSKLVKGNMALATGGAIVDAAAPDSTARYAQRFGVSEPTGDGSFGDVAKFAALRAGGFASDLGNRALLGLPGMLYRDNPQQAVQPAAAQPTAAQPPAQPAAAQPTAQPAGPITNPATPEQQSALGAMGVTTDRVINPGAGVDLATANQIERQGRYGGQDGMVTQLKGYGDQNSIYGRASRPGGKVNEFYGAGTGKASTPGSIGLNVVPSSAITAPPSGEAAAAALKAAADRGDWRSIEGYYAKQGQGFGGKTAEQIQAEQRPQPPVVQDTGGDWARAEYQRVMSMPTSTFSDRAAKRAALAALSRGVALAGVESRERTDAANTQARLGLDRERIGLDRERIGLDRAKIGAELAKASAEMTDAQKLAAIRDKALAGDQGAIAQWNLLNPRKAESLGHQVVTQSDVDEMGNKIEKPIGILDKGTGAVRPFQVQSSPQGEYAKFKAAWDANADPAARKRLEDHARSMGLIK